MEGLDVLARVVMVVVLLGVSWCVMTFTHEVGHVLFGWSCGGTLRAVELRPWRLPYSLFEPDPFPLATLWGGPLLGVVIPLAMALIARRNEGWFLASFCLLANGLYLATAWISGDRFLDTPRLLANGAHPATIVIYCLLTIGFGYVGLRHHGLRLVRQGDPGTKSA